MPEISLNILDVAENSTRAGASFIRITVDIQPETDRLTVIITDDGCGMTSEQLERVTDPFYTSRTTRKVRCTTAGRTTLTGSRHVWQCGAGTGGADADTGACENVVRLHGILHGIRQ